MTTRLALKQITKQYPAVVANDKVDLTVLPGEIHAVLGENGAGKTTLMKIAYGMLRPARGEIRMNGSARVFASPAAAIAAGIRRRSWRPTKQRNCTPGFARSPTRVAASWSLHTSSRKRAGSPIG